MERAAVSCAGGAVCEVLGAHEGTLVRLTRRA